MASYKIHAKLDQIDEPVISWRSWGVVLLLMLVYTTSFIDRTAISLLVGPIRADLAITDTQMSLLSGFAFALFYTGLGIPLGRLADRRSRRLIIALGAITWSVMTMLCGVTQNFWQLFLARMGVGVGEASLSPAAYSLISDTFPRRILARAMGVYNVGISLGSGMALVFGGILIALIDRWPPLRLPFFGALRAWQTMFILAALPGLFLGACVLLITEPRRRGTATSESGDDDPALKQVVGYIWHRRNTFGALYVGYSLLALVSFSMLTWAPTHFIRSYGWTPAETGQRFGLAVLTFGTLGSLLGGYFADRMMRLGMKFAYMRVSLIAALGLAPLSLAAPLMPTGRSSLAAFCLWLLFHGCWLTICGGSIQLITPNRMRGQAIALMFLFSSTVGWGLGPTAVAMITDFGFQRDGALRYSMAIVGAVAAPLAALVFRYAERTFATELVHRERIEQAQRTSVA